LSGLSELLTSHLGSIALTKARQFCVACFKRDNSGPWPKPRDKQPPKKKVKKGLFTKLDFLSLASLMIAAILTWVVALSIEELPILKGAIGRNNYSDVLFMVCLVGFIVSISASAYAFISKEELSGEVHVKKFNTQEKNLWKEALEPKRLTP
jgi:hypothetical protein